MQNFVQITVGVLLAVGLILVVRRIGDYRRETAVYSFGLIAAALIYFGFGMFSDSFGWKLTELGGLLIYAFFAILGLRYSAWFLSGGWFLHVFWDVFLHDHSTAFVPFWYPKMCLGFDLAVAGYVGFREWRIKAKR